MYACPWCGTEKSFSFWEKQTLGPRRELNCPHCNRKVSVCWERAQLAAIPVIALAFLGMLFGRHFYGDWPAVLLGLWLGTTLGMSITAPLYHLSGPLVRPTS